MYYPSCTVIFIFKECFAFVGGFYKIFFTIKLRFAAVEEEHLEILSFLCSSFSSEMFANILVRPSWINPAVSFYHIVLKFHFNQPRSRPTNRTDFRPMAVHCQTTWPNFSNERPENTEIVFFLQAVGWHGTATSLLRCGRVCARGCAHGRLQAAGQWWAGTTRPRGPGQGRERRKVQCRRFESGNDTPRRMMNPILAFPMEIMNRN